MSAFLAVDLGQGACRVMRPGAPTSVVEFEGFRPDRDPFEQIATAVLAVVASSPQMRLGIGMTGLNGAQPEPSRLVERLREAGIHGEIAIADDSVTAYLGALGQVSGAVVSAGTGAVALGVNLGSAVAPGNGVARSDGWGATLGDRGSGYWIGIEAVREALRSYDRGHPSALFDLVERFCGDPTGLSARWRETPPLPGYIASLAPEVAALARQGDGDAAAIWQRAGELLADSVTDVVHHAGLANDSVPVAAVGGLMGSADLLAAAFAARVTSTCPNVSVVAAAGSSLDGAALLATTETLHPALESQITRAFITERIVKP